MDRIKLFKELNSVANILEDNGKISEASQITNVLIRIAQGAGVGSTGQQPTGQQSQGQQQATPEQKKELYKTRFIEMLKLRNLVDSIKKKLPSLYLKYTIDQDGYKIDTLSTKYVGKTLRELYDNFVKANPSVNLRFDEQDPDEQQKKVADEVAKNIATAELWPDPQGDPAITKAINEKYILGYNLLGGTYYIGSKTNSSDNYDDKNIENLKDVFLKLGEHYKKFNNQFPEHIYQALGKSEKYDDVNDIIFQALEMDEPAKLKFLQENYSGHPNYKDIIRGFYQEYNKRNPTKKITEKQSPVEPVADVDGENP